MPAALERLKKRSEFLAVAAANRRWTSTGLVLQARPHVKIISDSIDTPDAGDRQAGGLRVGFTATKKIGNAVKRNRARRRLRAAVSEVLKDSGAMPIDLVVVARQSTVARPFSDLKNDLSIALKRLGLAT